MKKTICTLLTLIAGLAILLAVLHPVTTASALPEYSAQTGEPCATCHISPSGGGSRGPRGQAWVASSKPGTVPDLIQSLDILGVHLDVDESQFKAAPDPLPEAPPLSVEPVELEALQRWLQEYPGN